jgi:hypothetical protein
MTSTATALAVATLVGGCASGGGGAGQNDWDSDWNAARNRLNELACNIYRYDECPRSDAGSPVARLTSWQAVPPGVTVSAGGPVSRIELYGSGDRAQDVGIGGTGSAREAELTYAEGRRIRTFNPGAGYYHPDGGSTQFAGRSEIDTVWLQAFGWNETARDSMFTSTPGSVAVVANPYVKGWNYQSFGAWTTGWADGAESAAASSFGAPTMEFPGTSTPGDGTVPSSGTATFVGALVGLYVNTAGGGSVVAADLRVTANFSERTLGVASSNTISTRDPSGAALATARPDLNVSGTLSYSAGSSAFSGTLANAAGTMGGTSRGQFYGPQAEELGGAFTLRSAAGVESFVGAYGAKR